MTKPVTNIFVARVTIEFTTPFHVGSGDEGDISDAAVRCDVNGLPAIPGSGLAGVLRSACSDSYGIKFVNELFGFQEKSEGSGSRLSVSWACIHNQENVPVEGIMDTKNLDAILSNAICPTLRDHVRIDHRGTSSSADRGKFDELAVCAGHRFTFECTLTGLQEDQQQWDRFLAVLQDRSLRIGGKTRRGFGSFNVVKLKTRVFDLSDPSGYRDYCEYPVDLSKPAKGLSDLPVEAGSLSAFRCLTLQPQEYWMFGGGEDISDDGSDADMAPVTDKRIRWKNDQGTVERNVLYLPGSSIKGALAHRTAYHYNRSTGKFGDKLAIEEFEVLANHNPGVELLFGYAKEGSDNDNKGHRGRVIIDDIFLDEKDQNSQLVHHVSIDRFTGGARTLTGGLFSERPFWKGQPIEITIRVVDTDQIDPITRAAFDAALKDLCSARLPLGGGSGRGLGFFRVISDTGWKNW